MSKTPIALFASIIVLGLAGSAVAQTKTDTTPNKDTKKEKADKRSKARASFEQRFKAADKNSDGSLTKDEAAGMKNIQQNFDAMDSNKDGKVTIAEHDAWQSQKQAAKKAAKASTPK